MTSLSLYTASAVMLAFFLLLSVVDGFYFHLWVYRLHTRAASRREHWVHTWRAVLFVPLLPTLFLWQTGGGLLWAGLGLLIVDQVFELADMLWEKDSRADLGGLSTSEYTLHMTISTARGASLALGLAARPAEAWSLGAPWVLGPMPAFAWLGAWQSLPGAVLGAVLHAWLLTEGGVRAFEAGRARLVSSSRT